MGGEWKERVVCMYVGICTHVCICMYVDEICPDGKMIFEILGSNKANHTDWEDLSCHCYYYCCCGSFFPPPTLPPPSQTPSQDHGYVLYIEIYVLRIYVLKISLEF